MRGIVVSATSDIATEMCLSWCKRGWNLYGTFFSKGSNYERLKSSGVVLTYCDLADKNSVDRASEEFSTIASDWDFLLFATGSLSPVGLFEKIAFDDWERAISLNFLNQMRLLHRLLPIRNSRDVEKSVLFFAGGGTNNAFDFYSSYTLSKIALIKACELLDAELRDVKFSIIGPGWVKTKIHRATIDAGYENAGANFKKTYQKLANNDGVLMEDVVRSFEWVLNQPKKIVGGRNFSTVYDCWGTNELCDLLANDQDLYKLRRNGNQILLRDVT